MDNKYNIKVKSFEELEEWQKMILSIKGAVEEIKKNKYDEDYNNFLGAFITVTIDRLNAEYGITKDEIFKYKLLIS